MYQTISLIAGGNDTVFSFEHCVISISIENFLNEMNFLNKVVVVVVTLFKPEKLSIGTYLAGEA